MGETYRNEYKLKMATHIKKILEISFVFIQERAIFTQKTSITLNFQSKIKLVKPECHSLTFS